MRVEAEARCRFGCPWSDHDRDGICYRDCGRCPEKCRGDRTKDEYQPKNGKLWERPAE